MKCKHDWQENLYLGKHKQSENYIFITEICTMISICKKCDDEKSEVVSGGIVYKKGIATEEEGG